MPSVHDSNLTYCVPGDRICEATDDFIAGDGTYTLDHYIYGSLTGYVKTVKDGNLTIIKVENGEEGNHLLPEVGSIATCRVLSVNPVQAIVSIIGVNESILHQPFQGAIKKLNVRKHQVDLVEMYDCFRPKDILIAKVLSLGSARNYELSTATNELGVVSAKCEEGHNLVPISWTVMKCQCGTENRKVAKVAPPKDSANS